MHVDPAFSKRKRAHIARRTSSKLSLSAESVRTLDENGFETLPCCIEAGGIQEVVAVLSPVEVCLEDASRSASTDAVVADEIVYVVERAGIGGTTPG